GAGLPDIKSSPTQSFVKTFLFFLNYPVKLGRFRVLFSNYPQYVPIAAERQRVRQNMQLLGFGAG
ncbi:hypothetical protein OFC08_29685, partial [Escherichia coli]|nr:hypothetical protein [Escherichia coli]